MDEYERPTIEDGSLDVLATEKDFLALLPPYLGMALQESLEPVIHVFSHSEDKWTQDTHNAYATFREWVEKYDTAWLYIELYLDRENDVMILEDCLLSHGDYPV